MGFNDELEIKTADDIVSEQLSGEMLKSDEPSEDTVNDTTQAVGESAEETPSKPAVAEDHEETVEDEASAEETPTKKRKFPLQVPVIIAACIVLGALIGYFCFNAFFLHEPEGLWVTDYETTSETGDPIAVTYYYEFNQDGTCVMTLGSIDNYGAYYKSQTETGRSIYVNQYYGIISGEYQYTITGSKIFGNQKMTLTSSDGGTFELRQAGSKDMHLKVADDFKENPDLTGSWEFNIPEYGVNYTFTFNRDGTMIYNQADTVIYNATYTMDDQTIYMSFCALDPEKLEVVELPYTINGDSLKLMDLDCTRVGSTPAATPDET